MFVYSFLLSFPTRPENSWKIARWTLNINQSIYQLSFPNCICSVMVSMLALIAVDRGFEPWSGQTKDY
jgi:hypothetical protein